MCFTVLPCEGYQMDVVTGDRYVELLVKFVGKEAGSLIDGLVVLKLNPAGLHYVYSRLEALHEVESLLVRAPVDYLRAYVSDLGDHRALEQLRRILRLLTSLKVVSSLPHFTRDPTPLSLSPFMRLRVLELRCCDLSTSAAKGLLELRHTLEKIICFDSTDALRHIFTSRVAEIHNSPQWRRLSYASFACNNLVLMDDSLLLLPSIETLDLSRNRFSKIDNMRRCTKLKNVDLGFNQIRSISSLNEVSLNLVKLVMRNNAITSLDGLQNLRSLEGLDVSYNIISEFSELEYITSLQNLKNLWLEGNPLTCARWYRAHVYSHFSHPSTMKLDGRGISTRELWKRQVFLATRYQLRSSFGFYLPAKDHTDVNSPIVHKKRKVSRLACIDYDNGDNLIDFDQNSDDIHENDSYESKAFYLKEESVLPLSKEMGNLIDHDRNHQDETSSLGFSTKQHSKIDHRSELDIINDFGKFYSDSSHVPSFQGRKFDDAVFPFKGNGKHFVSSSKNWSSSSDESLPNYQHNILQNRNGLTDESYEKLAEFSSETDTSSSAGENDSAPGARKFAWSQNCERTTDNIFDNLYRKERAVKIMNTPNEQPSLPQSKRRSSNVSHEIKVMSVATSEIKNDGVSDYSIQAYFKAHIADSYVNEAFVACVRSSCILEPQSLHKEREVALISSSQNKLYVLLISVALDGSGHLSLLEGHKFEDIREILAGFGLQTIRLSFSKGASYIFLTGSVEKSTQLLSLLFVLFSSNSIPPFKSLEQVQAESFWKDIYGGLSTTLFQYSLIHFSDQSSVECRPRSLFLAGGQIIVCVEDLTLFTSYMGTSSSQNYFHLDSYCSVKELCELVVDVANVRVIIGIKRLCKERRKQENITEKWNVKWYCEGIMRKFVDVVKAIYGDMTGQSLRVYIS